jgi:Domain of unknown function (DUF5664)
MISTGSKVRFLYNSVIGPVLSKGTVKSMPNSQIAWVHMDGNPENEEYGIRINELEEIVEESKLGTILNPLYKGCENMLSPINNHVKTESLKKDDNKFDPTMITLEMLELVSRVRMFGAKKYARNNFKITGFKYTRSLAAALRHIYAFLNGEDNDPESGLSHLGHAICSLEHCIYDTKNHPENDDRK